MHKMIKMDGRNYTIIENSLTIPVETGCWVHEVRTIT